MLQDSEERGGLGLPDLKLVFCCLLFDLDERKDVAEK